MLNAVTVFLEGKHFGFRFSRLLKIAASRSRSRKEPHYFGGAGANPDAKHG
jgi:hypothetical protein